MNGGKKYIVISQEEYARLKEGKQASESIIHPEKRELKKSEKEMRDIWTRDDLPVDEKIRIFTDELNNLKMRYDSLIKPKSMEVIFKNDHEKDSKRDIIEESIIQSVSKSSKANAQLLIDYLKTKPEIIKWNQQGEMLFRDEAISGSNITDMIIDTTANRKRSTIPPMFKSIFLKAMAEANVPSKWIKNKEHNDILQSYKDMKSRNVYTPDKKKLKVDWLSST